MSKYLIVIVVQIAIIVGLIVMLCDIKESVVVRRIFSVLLPLFSFLVEFLPNIISKKDDTAKRNTKSKLERVLIVISWSLFIIIVTISIVGNTMASTEFQSANTKGNSAIEVDTTQNIEAEQPRKYFFNTINLDEDYDIYFMMSPYENDLYRDLSFSLESIEYRIKPDDAQLEGNNAYGNNAKAAGHYEELIKDELDNVNAIAIDVNKLICDTAISISEEMDSVYDMPNNRNRIVRLTRISYENGLTDDIGKMKNKCIRYAWGLLYTEISYDLYNENTIELLIDLYKEMDQPDRCMTIISALSRIKDAFHSNAPHPITAIK